MIRLTLALALSVPFLAAPTLATAQEQTVVYLVRKPLVVRSPEQFQVPIALQPATEVTLTATAAGPVQTVLCKLGEAVTSQSELIRVDSEEQRLLVERAQAALKVAEAEADGASKQAKIDLAGIDLKLANLRLDRTKSLAPFNGRVVGVHVVSGQYVREATPLVTLIDSSILTALVPIERDSAKAGDTFPVSIEGKPYDARVKAVLPLDPKFEPLRDLFASVATAFVELDNSSGDLKAGQTVRSDLIPRDPVAEVPNTSVATDTSGVRQVFVIRRDIAVAVPVQVLSAVGEKNTFVAGEFAEGDELVTSGAESLVDGRRVVPATAAPVDTTVGAAAPAGGQPGAAAPAGAPAATQQPPAATGGF